MNKQVDEPIFLVGYQRSGTTLLAAALDRNSQIAVPPETHYVDYMTRVFGASKGVLPTKDIVEAIAGNARMDDLDIAGSEIESAVGASESTLPEVLAKTLAIYKERQGKAVCIEKTPAHVDYVDVIFDWFPNAKCIWIVRDGRDVVLSLCRSPWTHENVRRHSNSWQICMRKMREWKERYGDKVHVVSYESLLRTPEEELRKVHDFLGIAFEPAQLVPTSDSNVCPEWEAEWKKKTAQAFDPSRIQSWRREASLGSLAIMNSMLGKELDKLGYEESDRYLGSWLKRLVNFVMNSYYRFVFLPPVKKVLKLFAWALSKLGVKYKPFR